MKNLRRVIAIIPARSGSKGLKDKNIKCLHGKPLLAYSIEAALKSGIFTDVIVSTNSEEYKIIAEKYGGWVPFLRPEELSNDTASTNDVIENTLLTLKSMGLKYDCFMLLQPTSPLRDETDIRGAFNMFISKEANSVISMCECSHSPTFTKSLDEDKKLDGFLDNLKNVRRQDLNKYYRLNGAIYLSKIDYFFKYKNFYKEKSYAFIMDKRNSVDIDDIDDFIYAEFLINKKKSFYIKKKRVFSKVKLRKKF